MQEVLLYGQASASGVVSAVDVDLVGDHKWYGTTGYMVTRLNGKTTYLHRLIMIRVLGRELNRREEVDHINGNGLDNRRENLRLASHAQNLKNLKVPVNSTTGYKGVSYRKDKRKFEAYIKFDKQPRKRLGYFRTAVDGAKAYNEAAKKYHGEFARLNEIREAA